MVQACLQGTHSRLLLRYKVNPLTRSPSVSYPRQSQGHAEAAPRQFTSKTLEYAGSSVSRSSEGRTIAAQHAAAGSAADDYDEHESAERTCVPFHAASTLAPTAAAPPVGTVDAAPINEIKRQPACLVKPCHGVWKHDLRWDGWLDSIVSRRRGGRGTWLRKNVLLHVLKDWLALFSDMHSLWWG